MRGGSQVDLETAFVSIGDVPGDMREFARGKIILEGSSINNLLAAERIPADVVHGHERIGKAEVFALDVSLLVKLSIEARTREILRVGLPGDTSILQQVDNVGNIELMSLVVPDVEGRSSNGPDVIHLGGMTKGTIVGQKLSFSGKNSHKGILDNIVVICIGHEDDQDSSEESSFLNQGDFGWSSKCGCMTSCPTACRPTSCPASCPASSCLASSPAESISSGSLRISPSLSLNRAERDEDEDHSEN